MTNHSLHTIRVSHEFRLFVLFCPCLRIACGKLNITKTQSTYCSLSTAVFTNMNFVQKYSLLQQKKCFVFVKELPPLANAFCEKVFHKTLTNHDKSPSTHHLHICTKFVILSVFIVICEQCVVGFIQYWKTPYLLRKEVFICPLLQHTADGFAQLRVSSTIYSVFYPACLYAEHTCQLLLPNIVGWSSIFHRISSHPVSVFHSTPVVDRVSDKRIWSSHHLSSTYLRFLSVTSKYFILLTTRTVITVWLLVQIICSFTIHTCGFLFKTFVYLLI